jgi:hypothetical protein
MKQMIFAATLAGALFLGNIADAQPRGKHNDRKKNQQERIHDGVRKGSITRNEAMRLQMQQAKLRGYRQMAKVDGRVNGKERKLLRGEMRRADHNIYKAKHNGQFRKGKAGYAGQGQGYRGGRNDLRKGGGAMAYKGQGAQGRGGDHYRKDGNNAHKGQGFQRRDSYRGENGYRKGGQDHRGSDRRKDNNNDKKATWQLNDDSRKGSWELN